MLGSSCFIASAMVFLPVPGKPFIHTTGAFIVVGIVTVRCDMRGDDGFWGVNPGVCERCKYFDDNEAKVDIGFTR